MDRQEGYYWVKYKGYYIIGEYLTSEVWIIPGKFEEFEDSDFEHINEVRIKEPGELPD